MNGPLERNCNWSTFIATTTRLQKVIFKCNVSTGTFYCYMVISKATYHMYSSTVSVEVL